MSGDIDVDRMRSDPTRQATAWLIQLSDEPDNEALRVQFIDWLSMSSAHIAAWEETARVSELMSAAGPLHKIAPVAVSARQTWFLKLGRVQTLATLAIAACFAWLVVPDPSLWMRSDEITRSAELRVVRLADGTIVHLAPATAIAFTNGTKDRGLTLLQGEAWFDVAHDKARPFRLRAGENIVTVLGTAFSVRKTENGADVAVQRGHVAVSTPGDGDRVRADLVAGQSVSINAGTVLRGTIRPDRVASWRAGVAIVSDQPIGEVIARLRPWYKGYIVTRGPGLKDRRVSGIYDLREPDLALEALAQAHKVTISRVSPWLRIVTVS